MKATRFMRIPFVVSGFQVTNENMDAIASWCQGHVVRENAGRPFVRVPVNRATNTKQTEAYEGMWVIVSIQRDQRSFKVYSQEWLDKQFFKVSEESLMMDRVDLNFPRSMTSVTGIGSTAHLAPPA